jgi:hypothetical protein
MARRHGRAGDVELCRGRDVPQYALPGARSTAPAAACLPAPELCECTYKHFEDRRTGVRRGADVGKGGDGPKSDRRATRGRRAKDQQR